MRRFLALSTPALLALAPTAFGQLDIEIEVTGSVTAVHTTPVTPFQGVQPGDPVRLTMKFSPTLFPAGPAIGTYYERGNSSLLEIGTAAESSFQDLFDRSALVVQNGGFSAPVPDEFLTGFKFSQNPAALVTLRAQDFTTTLIDSFIATEIEGTYRPSQFTSIAFAVTNPDGQTSIDIELDRFILGEPTPELGNPYCSAPAPNSTGVGATMDPFGSREVAANDLTIEVSDLPTNSFGFLVTSRTQGNTANPGGSQGTLCLGGAIGRLLGSLQSSGSAGRFSFSVDLTEMPTPTGVVPVLAGERWNFQTWYRDANPSATSNFSSAYSIRFE
ncbi:MAG: hypothetical protein AAGB93_10925 [Planctomycetota bacterium]